MCDVLSDGEEGLAFISKHTSFSNGCIANKIDAATRLKNLEGNEGFITLINQQINSSFNN